MSHCICIHIVLNIQTGKIKKFQKFSFTKKILFAYKFGFMSYINEFLIKFDWSWYVSMPEVRGFETIKVQFCSLNVIYCITYFEFYMKRSFCSNKNPLYSKQKHRSFGSHEPIHTDLEIIRKTKKKQNGTEHLTNYMHIWSGVEQFKRAAACVKFEM